MIRQPLGVVGVQPVGDDASLRVPPRAPLRLELPAHGIQVPLELGASRLGSRELLLLRLQSLGDGAEFASALLRGPEVLAGGSLERIALLHRVLQVGDAPPRVLQLNALLGHRERGFADDASADRDLLLRVAPFVVSGRVVVEAFSVDGDAGRRSEHPPQEVGGVAWSAGRRRGRSVRRRERVVVADRPIPSRGRRARTDGGSTTRSSLSLRRRRNRDLLVDPPSYLRHVLPRASQLGLDGGRHRVAVGVRAAVREHLRRERVVVGVVVVGGGRGGIDRVGCTGSDGAEEILRGRAEHLLGAFHRRLHRGVDRGHPRRRFARGRRRRVCVKVGFHSPSDDAGSLRRGRALEGKLGGRVAVDGGVVGVGWTPGGRRGAGVDRVRGPPASAAEQLSLELGELLLRSPRPGGLERGLERRDVGGVDRITREYGGVDVLRRGVRAHVARVLAECVDEIRVRAVREEPRGDWPLAIPASLVQRGVALRVWRIDVEALADAVLEDDAETAQVAARGGGEQRRRPRRCPRRVRHPFVPELLRRQTLTKLSTIPRPIRHRAAVARSRVLSSPRPPRVYDRLGRGPRVSRRGAQTLCAPGKWWSSRSPPKLERYRESALCSSQLAPVLSAPFASASRRRGSSVPSTDPSR